MSTPRHPLSLQDLELLETETLTDRVPFSRSLWSLSDHETVLARLTNANQHLRRSNEDLRAEDDDEMKAFAAENDDLMCARCSC